MYRSDIGSTTENDDLELKQKRRQQKYGIFSKDPNAKIPEIVGAEVEIGTSCGFGRECEKLMRKYKQLNIDPKYVHKRTEFGFNHYVKFVPNSCLI